MREIKFRLWDDYSKSFFYIDFNKSIIEKYVNEAGITDSETDNRSIATRDLNSGKWEQYLGLKDRSNIIEPEEIYEGDIVEAWRDDGYLSYRGEIGYHDGPSYITIDWNIKDEDGEIVKDSIPWFQLEYTHHLKIIGNIHENPELLNNH